jgi:L-ascorbate metabolism protein UlaG (beta-lactamase superfamily)
VALRNGESHTVGSVKIEALPAYNTSRGRDRFHPKGRDNGYLLTIDGKRIYIAGDTEDTPEMKALKNIDLAFLPMNQPYTMTPEQVARAVRAFKPRVLYPYHTGDTDTARLTALLEGKGVEVRVRRLQ